MTRIEDQTCWLGFPLRGSDLSFFAFLATYFFFYSKKEVSKKMPFPVTCPQKAAGSRKCFDKLF